MEVDDYKLKEIVLSSTEFGQIEFFQSAHQNLSNAGLFDDTNAFSMEARGDFGALLFHELKNTNCTFFRGIFKIDRDFDLKFLFNTPSLGLCFPLKNHF